MINDFKILLLNFFDNKWEIRRICPCYESVVAHVFNAPTEEKVSNIWDKKNFLAFSAFCLTFLVNTYSLLLSWKKSQNSFKTNNGVMHLIVMSFKRRINKYFDTLLHYFMCVLKYWFSFGFKIFQTSFSLWENYLYF